MLFIWFLRRGHAYTYAHVLQTHLSCATVSSVIGGNWVRQVTLLLHGSLFWAFFDNYKHIAPNSNDS